MKVSINQTEGRLGHLADSFRLRIERYESEGLRLMVSSSFQTQSLPLLSMVSIHCRGVPVYFLDTGYHFPATLAFRDEIARLLSLDVRSISSNTPLSMQRSGDGRFFFSSDPDWCCHLNKTMSMESMLPNYDVWIAGVRRDQTSARSTMSEEMPGPSGTLRYHPMLNWTNYDVSTYIKAHDLPSHPLEAFGYQSVGCEPCTFRPSPDDADRDGRWQGLRKTECGLHTGLVGR